MAWITKKIAASGILYNGPCDFGGFLLGMDGTNDVTDVTIHSGTDATGDEIVPTNPYEADYKGLNGVAEWLVYCPNGVYAAFTCPGSAELVARINPK